VIPLSPLSPVAYPIITSLTTHLPLSFIENLPTIFSAKFLSVIIVALISLKLVTASIVFFSTVSKSLVIPPKEENNVLKFIFLLYPF
jgi:hypothetical protein